MDRESPNLLPENLSRKKFYFWLLKYVRGKKAVVLFITLCVITVTFIMSTIPILIGQVIDILLLNTAEDVIKSVIDICTFMLMLVLVRGALMYLLNGVNDISDAERIAEEYFSKR